MVNAFGAGGVVNTFGAGGVVDTSGAGGLAKTISSTGGKSAETCGVVGVTEKADIDCVTEATGTRGMAENDGMADHGS